MTADRLEKLAEFATEEGQGAGQYCDAQSILRAAKFRDLARCARAWAKVEREMMATGSTVEIMGCRGRELPWAWYPGSVTGRLRYTGYTAIEAVEAAEATDANKG